MIVATATGCLPAEPLGQQGLQIAQRDAAIDRPAAGEGDQQGIGAADRRRRCAGWHSRHCAAAPPASPAGGGSPASVARRAAWPAAARCGRRDQRGSGSGATPRKRAARVPARQAPHRQPRADQQQQDPGQHRRPIPLDRGGCAVHGPRISHSAAASARSAPSSGCGDRLHRAPAGAARRRRRRADRGDGDSPRSVDQFGQPRARRAG